MAALDKLSIDTPEQVALDFALASIGSRFLALAVDTLIQTGATLLLVLFGLLVWRIMLIGWQSRDTFGMLIAAGLASMILFQLLVNVGMVVGIMPVTGIPLPFVTYGGSSLISLLFGLGILQSIRMRSNKPDL